MIFAAFCGDVHPFARVVCNSTPSLTPHLAWQVCLGSCVLYATLRRQGAPGGAASATAHGSTSGEQVVPAGKRSAKASPAVKAGGGVSKSEGGKKRGKGKVKEEAVSSKVTEAEGLVKDGRADISGLKGAVLRIAECVPEKAWRAGHWRRVSYPAWRAFIHVATGPRELMQVRRGCRRVRAGFRVFVVFAGWGWRVVVVRVRPIVPTLAVFVVDRMWRVLAQLCVWVVFLFLFTVGRFT